MSSTAPSPLARQVGGTHYQVHAIQPIAIAEGNRLRPAAALALKHMTRPGKGQVLEDIRKAKHYLEFLAQRWPAVSASDFVLGLGSEVPEWMRQVAWHIVMTANPMADPEQHRRDALRILNEQLAARAPAVPS